MSTGLSASRRPGPLAAIGLLAAVTLSVALGACSGGSGGSSAEKSTTTTEVTTTTFGLPAGAEATGLRDLTAGQCFELPVDDPGADDRAVWALPCSDPHTHEVVSVLDYGGATVRGGGYPGRTVVQDWAEQNCYAGFEAAVGETWTESDFDIETWWPSEESWARRDRKVVCTVYPASGGRTTGPVRP